MEAIGENTDSPDVFTDLTPIRDSLNAAVQELALALGCHERTYHLPLLVGQSVYRMGFTSGGFGWVTECWDRARKYRLDQTSLLSLSAEDPEWLKRSGNPTRYIAIGEDHLALDRAPAGGGVLEITYTLIPADYGSSEDPVKLRESLERAAVHYAVSEFYASRGSAVHAAEAFAQYLDVAGIGIRTPAQAEREYAK